MVLTLAKSDLNMPDIPDDILLANLKQGENATYQLLYEMFFPSTANYIRQNSGNYQDAEDIFQESMIVLMDKVKQPDFVLTSSLKTYLFSISKNLWLKKIRNDKRLATGNNVDTIEMYQTVDEPQQYNKEEKLYRWLKKITANCRQILKAIFFLNEPMDTLMIKMGWKNKHTASNQKYKCIEQVRKESKE